MENKHFETKAIRAQLDRTEYNEHSVPLFLTSRFVFDSAEDCVQHLTKSRMTLFIRVM
jgi:O-succinylhomoserine sulfhydrylase